MTRRATKPCSAGVGAELLLIVNLQFIYYCFVDRPTKVKVGMYVISVSVEHGVRTVRCSIPSCDDV